MPYTNSESTLDQCCDVDGIWANFAPYLSLADIQSLKMTCRILNTTLDQLDVAWQPFLNQLHSIDEIISVTSQRGQTIKEAFFAAFEKVKTRQLAEINFLRETHTASIFANYRRLSAIEAVDANQTLTLSDLTVISAELDALNSDMMTGINAGYRYDHLQNLSVRGITRFSKELIENPEHETFWRNLRRLDIADNLLQSLPSNMHKLQGLAILHLSGNQLTTLPESIADIQSLNDLSCRYNQLKALPNSIGKLQNLRYLSLTSNQLTALPNSIGKLKNLRYLFLDRNQLTTLPSSIVELQALIELDCDRNQLKALPNSIGKLQNLRSLYLNSNHLTALPETIGELQRLYYLNCGHNQLSALPETIDELQELRTLDCIYNHLAALPEAIDELQKLRILNCSSNQLTALPISLANKFGERWATSTLATQRRPVDTAPVVADVAPTLLVKRKLESNQNAKRQRISPREIDSLRLDERWFPSAEKRNSKAKQSLTKRRK